MKEEVTSRELASIIVKQCIERDLAYNDRVSLARYYIEAFSNGLINSDQKKQWECNRPSFTMTLIENGVKLQTPTGDPCHFSGSEVLRLQDALKWAIEELKLQKEK